jgi:hypothetical protein
MFTWLWTKKYSKMAHRLQDLKLTREDNILSTELSAQTLGAAPDFWQRQHQAFCYVDKQIRRVNRQTRVWGSLALLAILADAVLVVGGLTTFQAFRQYQASRALMNLDPYAVTSSMPTDKAIEELSKLLSNPDPQVRVGALQALNALVEGNGYLAPSLPYSSPGYPTVTAATTPLDRQLQAIDQLGQTRTVEAVQPLITKLADSQATVRAAAAEALGQIGEVSALPHLEDRLLVETNEVVRQSLIKASADLFMRNLGQ